MLPARRALCDESETICGIDGPATAIAAGQRNGSAYRKPVLQAALGPQRVEAARYLERRTLADIALESVAVIADSLDDAISPIVAEPERRAKLALDTEKPADFRIGGLQL